jgi:methylated-DNA-[protein]-cysteine S-methyltransferase
MNVSGLHSFATPIGRCGIAWSDSGLLGLNLPEAGEAAAPARPRRRFPTASPAVPPDWIMEIVALIRAHLGGERVDYDGVRLDEAGVGAWERSVYAAARRIAFGETLSYGMLAARLGDPRQARAVGQALGRNPWPIVVPCHRITAADGRMGGFSAPGGAATKRRLLEIEGALAAGSLPLFASL